jgi:hypothetical protein
MSRTKLAAAYHAASQLRGLANLGTGGRTKTALSVSPEYLATMAKLREIAPALGRAGGATLAGAGVGALADDDSALEGALLGGLGGLGLGALGAHARRSAMNKVTDMAPPSIYGALGLGGLGGLGSVGVSNMIDDDDESVLARLGLG